MSSFAKLVNSTKKGLTKSQNRLAIVILQVDCMDAASKRHLFLGYPVLRCCAGDSLECTEERRFGGET